MMVLMIIFKFTKTLSRESGGVVKGSLPQGQISIAAPHQYDPEAGQ
jgi:hypothetical protein